MDKLPPHILPSSTPRVQPSGSSQTHSASVTSKTAAPLQTPSSTTPAHQPQTHTLQNSQALEQLTQALQQHKHLTLQVKSSQALNQHEQQLLQKLNPGAARQALASATTSTSASSTSTPSLYLIKLAHLPQQLSRTSDLPLNHLQKGLTTITTTPLKVGDKVQAQLNSQQQLVIKPSAATVRPAIVDLLRQTLPQQQTISQLANTIWQVQQLPAHVRQVLLSPQVNTSLAEFNRSPLDINKPISVTAIKSQLQNSGLFLENTLQQGKSAPQDLQVLLSKLQTLLKEAHAATTRSDAHVTPPSHTAKQLEQLLTLLLSPQTVTAPSNKLDAPTTQQLNSFLQLLGIRLTAQSGSAETLPQTQQVKDKLLTQLQQLVQGAQDKIRLNQLRSLANETPGTDTSTNRPLSVHVELPLRWGDQVLPLQLQLQEQIEERHHRESEHHEHDDEENKTLTKRWQVFLSFDLPGFSSKDESLHTQLTLSDNKVSATLWTESHTLYQTLEKQLSYLHDSFTANGLEVDDLECIEGKPPQEGFASDGSLMASLTQSYHLVDINT